MAGIGSGTAHTIREQIRSDHIMWLDEDTGSSLPLYLQIIEELRQELNRHLFLNLVDFEGHAAIYPPGSCYQKHLDQFNNNDQRTVTMILYLNENWQKSDGGELKIYTNEANSEYIELLPHLGYLVTFISSRYIHEVMPSNRTRLSITGWYKRRPVILQN
jgi:SM-20-related protein